MAALASFRQPGRLLLVISCVPHFGPFFFQLFWLKISIFFEIYLSSFVSQTPRELLKRELALYLPFLSSFFLAPVSLVLCPRDTLLLLVVLGSVVCNVWG